MARSSAWSFRLAGNAKGLTRAWPGNLKVRYLMYSEVTVQCKLREGTSAGRSRFTPLPTYYLFVVLPSTSVTGKHSTIPLRHVHLRCFSITRWPILRVVHMYGQYVWLKAGLEHETQNLLTTYLLLPFFRQKPLRLNLGPVCIWLGKLEMALR